MQELEEARELRRHTEREREELVKKAKNLQSKTQNRRNHGKLKHITLVCLRNFV